MNLKSILLLDAHASDRMRVAERPGLLRNFAIFFAHSGDSWFWGLGLIVVWGLGGSLWKRWSIIVLISIFILAVLVLSLKFIKRRRRPEGEWGGIYRITDPHSFPSGHAARAFMIAMVATGLGPAWFAMLLWIWAPLVALARVAMGVHYLSDILAGLGVGVLMGVIVLKLYPPLLIWIASMIKFPLF